MIRDLRSRQPCCTTETLALTGDHPARTLTALIDQLATIIVGKRGPLTDAVTCLSPAARTPQEVCFES